MLEMPLRHSAFENSDKSHKTFFVVKLLLRTTLGTYPTLRVVPNLKS